jgi:hypothetical protein
VLWDMIIQVLFDSNVFYSDLGGLKSLDLFHMSSASLDAKKALI